MTALQVVAQARPGFDPPGADIFITPCLTEFDLFGVEMCVNRWAIYTFVAAGIVIALFMAAAAKPGLVPRGVRTVAEAIVDFVREQIVLQAIGQDGLKYLPLLTAMFSFILVGNLFGIIPGIQFPVNSRMAIPAFLAAIVWVLFNFVGLKEQKWRYFKNIMFPPGVPKPMYAILTPIEVASTFLLRPFTLSVRLLANMMAGHLLLAVFFLGTGYLLGAPNTIPFAIPAFALSAALVAFELLVAVLQAYIFTILTAVYLGGAIHPEH